MAKSKDCTIILLLHYAHLKKERIKHTAKFSLKLACIRQQYVTAL